MITHGKNIKVFSANANPELAEAIAAKLGVTLGDAQVLNFSDGEIGVYGRCECIPGNNEFYVRFGQNSFRNFVRTDGGTILMDGCHEDRREGWFGRYFSKRTKSAFL